MFFISKYNERKELYSLLLLLRIRLLKCRVQHWENKERSFFLFFPCEKFQFSAKRFGATRCLRASVRVGAPGVRGFRWAAELEESRGWDLRRWRSRPSRCGELWPIAWRPRRPAHTLPALPRLCSSLKLLEFFGSVNFLALLCFLVDDMVWIFQMLVWFLESRSSCLCDSALIWMNWVRMELFFFFRFEVCFFLLRKTIGKNWPEHKRDTCFFFCNTK